MFLLRHCIYNHLNNSRVPDQNGVSQAWYIVETQHSGREPSTYNQYKCYFVQFQVTYFPLSAQEKLQASKIENNTQTPDKANKHVISARCVSRD